MIFLDRIYFSVLPQDNLDMLAVGYGEVVLQYIADFDLNIRRCDDESLAEPVKELMSRHH